MKLVCKKTTFIGPVCILLTFFGRAAAQDVEPAHFHHVHLNVTDPARTIAYYTKIHGATVTKYAGVADALFTERSFILMNKVDEPPASALERFTIEMAFICASEDEAGKEQKRRHSGLRRVFVTQTADAATSRWATDQS